MSSFWFIAAQNLMTATCQKEIFFFLTDILMVKSLATAAAQCSAVRPFYCNASRPVVAINISPGGC
jgi:hypothetical protein